MFGILKSGLKLGIGCFVAGILFILLIIGAWYYYFGRKTEPRPKNTNRRAAVVDTRGNAQRVVAIFNYEKNLRLLRLQ